MNRKIGLTEEINWIRRMLNRIESGDVLWIDVGTVYKVKSDGLRKAIVAAMEAELRALEKELEELSRRW